MKIALVSPSFLPAVGGAEYVVHNLAVEWGRQGHDVRVFNWVTDAASHPDATYSVRRFRLLRGAPRVGYHRFPWSGYTVRDLERLLGEYRPDFISGHMGYPTAVYLSRLRPARPFAITCHGRDLTLFDWGYRKQYRIERVLRRALNAATGCIAISCFSRTLMEELGVSSSVIRDIPNGVDLERFRRKVDFDLRAHLRLPTDALVILSVGREHPQKAYAEGLRAFARVARAHGRAHYVILGRGTATNQPLVAELGVSDRVRLCEGLHGDDLVGAYQQADVFFSPSIWEMMPLVVLEAMAAGIPAVVTNISGSQDLITSGYNGIVTEPGDLEAMADALLSLADSPPLRSKLAAGQRTRSEDYSWRQIAARYLELAGAT